MEEPARKSSLFKCWIQSDFGCMGFNEDEFEKEEKKPISIEELRKMTLKLIKSSQAPRIAKLKITNLKTWRTYIEGMAKLMGTEVWFRLDPNGIKMMGIDPARITATELDLPAEAFDEYVVKDTIAVEVYLIGGLSTEDSRKKEAQESKASWHLEESFSLPTDLLKEMISEVNASDELVIGFGRSDLTLTFGGKKKKFVFLAMSIGEKPSPKYQWLPREATKFTAKAKVLASAVQEKLRSASGFDIWVGLDKKSFCMSSEGDTEATKLRLQKGNEALVKLEVKKPARAMFGIINLIDILRMAKPSEVITINLGVNTPIRLGFPIAEGKGRLSFFVCQKIPYPES